MGFRFRPYNRPMAAKVMGHREQGAYQAANFSGPQLAPLPPQNNLFAYYTYDDADISGGNVLADRSGHGHPVTLNNLPTSVPGVSGQARKFAFASSQSMTYIADVGQDFPYTFGYITGANAPWSFAISLKGPFMDGNSGGTNPEAVLLMATGDNNNYIFIHWYNDGVTIEPFFELFQDGNDYNTVWHVPAPFDDTSSFFDLIFTSSSGYLGTHMKCYLNGVALVQSASNIPSNITPHANNASIGMHKSNSGNYYNGTRDEESWWTSELTLAQVQTIHQLRVQGRSLASFMGL